MLKQIKTKKFWLTIVRDGILLLTIFYMINFYQTRNTPNLTPELLIVHFHGILR